MNALVVLRPPVPGDRAALAAMYARCAAASRHARFLTLRPELPPAHVDEVVGPARGVRAVVALDPRTRAVVALGSLHPAARGPGGRVTAVEPALLVEDAWQRRGIGTLMLRHLLARARPDGPRELVASVLAGQRHVIRMIAGVAAGPLTFTREGPVVDIRADLAPARPDPNPPVPDRNPPELDRNPPVPDRNPHAQDRNPPVPDRYARRQDPDTPPPDPAVPRESGAAARLGPERAADLPPPVGRPR